MVELFLAYKIVQIKNCLQSDDVIFQDRLNNELGYQEIDCYINGGYSVGCRKEGDEVYVPFSFIHKYFEVNESRSFINF